MISDDDSEEEGGYSSCDVCLAKATNVDDLVCEKCDFLLCKVCQLRLRGDGGATSSEEDAEAMNEEEGVKRDEG